MNYRTILGEALARELGVSVGDTVVLIAPEGTATPSGVMPRMRRFHVVGLFESGMYEFDSGLALVHMADAAKLFRLGDKATGMRLALRGPAARARTVRQLAHRARRRLLRHATGRATTPTSSAPSRSPSR